MKTYQSRFRPEIDALAGYQPGEQPRMTNLVKLNTNENPYPPSPRVAEALRDFDSASLRRYSDPDSTALRAAIAERWGVGPERVIVRVPLIPQYNTPEDQQRSAERLRALGAKRLDLFSYVLREE